MYGDNQSALWNLSVPDSIIRKKLNSVAYHFIQERCARKECVTTYIKTDQNQSGIMTEPIPSGEC